jgi:hypothetical protein
MEKKDKAIVVIITDLTPTQAGEFSEVLIKNKPKIAPNGRGTIAITDKDKVGELVAAKTKKIIEKKKEK